MISDDALFDEWFVVRKIEGHQHPKYKTTEVPAENN
jgi:hypothetical protein